VQPPEDVGGETAIVGAGFGDLNFARQRGEFSCQVIGQHLSKKWADRNIGEEVAPLADMRLTIITMIAVVEREFHEARKRNNARASDFCLNPARYGTDVLAMPNFIQ
jgi:hypothetical protein